MEEVWKQLGLEPQETLEFILATDRKSSVTPPSAKFVLTAKNVIRRLSSVNPATNLFWASSPWKTWAWCSIRSSARSMR